MRKALEVFGYRHYRVLWVSTLFSFTAMQMQQVARALLAWQLTGSFGAVGAVTLSFGLPMLLFSLVGGSLADRVEKRNLSLLTQGSTSIIMLVTAILVATDTITFGILFAIGFVQGTFFALGTPARTPMMVETVGPEKIMSAIAMSNAAMNFTRLFGPAVAGVIVSVSGIGAVYFAQSGLYLVSSALLLLVPTGLSAAARARGGVMQARPQGNMLREMGLGLAYVWQNPRLRLLIAMMFVITMIGMPYILLLPGFVQEDLGQSESAYGWLQSVTGAGALVAALGVASFTEFERKPLVQWIAGIAGAGGLFVLALGSVAFGFAGALVAALILGLLFTAYQTLNNTMIMSEADPAYYGRVMSINMMTFSGMALVGAPLGLLADVIGATATFTLQGAIIVGVMLLLAVTNRGYTFGREAPVTFSQRQAAHVALSSPAAASLGDVQPMDAGSAGAGGG
ncbi:MAG: MFS transporter [Chloroflexi bacterium]|nr:MFS transporter [Chloroflexota bacterium]